MANLNIFQLCKLARRIPRRLRGVEHKLGRCTTPSARKYFEAQRAFLNSRRRIIEYTIAARNIGGMAIRCALPLKVQRNLGLLPKLS